jgi:hypothetical protein
MTVTHWDLINCSEDVRLQLDACDHLTVLGYSEEAFPQVEQRYLMTPRFRSRVQELMQAGRFAWWSAGDWRDYDRILAWRGRPEPCDTQPKQHFVCQNLNHRPHRYDFVVRAVGAGWLPHSRISYGNQSMWWDDCDCGRYHYNEEHRGKNPVIRELEAHFDPDPRYADPRWQALGTVEMPAPPVHTWETCAVNIVTETDKTHPYPTEKTWQVILYGRPFFVLSGAGSVEYLEGAGIRMDSNMLDHSYDQVTRGKDRIGALLASMEQLRDITPAEIYQACSSTARANQLELVGQIARSRLPKPMKLAHKGWVSANARRSIEHCSRVIGAAQEWLELQ